IAEKVLPAGLSGIVLAAAVAAMMSTASGALIACATVTRADVVPFLGRLFKRDETAAAEGGNPEHEMRSNRVYVVVIGVLATVIAMLLSDVVTALTIAYDILVGGLLVPILGGFLWKRATGAGALAAMGAGTLATLVTMAFTDVLANEPIYVGLGASLIVYIVVSLLTPRTPADVLEIWDGRLAGTAVAESDDPLRAVHSQSIDVVAERSDA
ncbi:MAG: sodium:solute symporter, partial [Microbacterium sp.]